MKKNVCLTIALIVIAIVGISCTDKKTPSVDVEINTSVAPPEDSVSNESTFGR